MMNKITFTRQEKKFLKTYFSKKCLNICAANLESDISKIVKAYNDMDRLFKYQSTTNDGRRIDITYNFDFDWKKQADFVSVAINIDEYIYRDLVKNKRIGNKYDLYEVTAKVSDFIRKELNYEKE